MAVPIDHQERERAIHDLDTTFLVEAAAGTGKTTLAIARILEAIRTGKAKMEEIVAITFTEKAAGELKIRLRDNLEKARQEARGEERKRIEDGVRQFERAHINTIHGFCSWLLKERPIEAAVDPNFLVLDELATQLLEEETWTEWFDQQMEEPPEVLKRALFAEVNPAQLREIAFELVRKRDRLHLDALVRSEHSVADGVAELQSILAKLRPKLANCHDTTDGAHTQIKNLCDLADRISPLRDYRQEYELIHSIHVRGNAGNKKNWKPELTLTEIKDAYPTLKAVPARRCDALLRDLAAWLKGFVHAFERAKASRGALDFDDLLLKTRQLLRSNLAVRAEFQRRFSHLLVDEFQDTDPTQAEIVFWLAEDGAQAKRWDEVTLRPGKLFLVGDPKQSIYRFRRADIEIYEAAKQIVGRQGKVLNIRQSFRTVSGLLAWVNFIFKQLIRPPEDGGMYQPSYEELKPWPERHTDFPSVCLLQPTKEQKARIAEANSRMEVVRPIEAREVARLIEHLVESGEWKVQGREDKELRSPRYRDFAILLHSPATSLTAYESALQQQGIPYQVEGGKDYFQSQEVRTVCALLLALDDPMNIRELVGVLRSAVFGFSDEEIYLWAEEKPLSYQSSVISQQSSVGDALAVLRRLHEQRNAHSFAGYLELLYNELKLPELFSLKPHGDQRVANLMKLLAVAQRLQDSKLLSLREFVNYLRTTALDRSEEGQSPSAEAQDDVVKVLSIHKAKGLEWSVVVVGDLGADKRTHHSLFLASRESQEVGLRLHKDMLTENYETLHSQEKKRQDAEEVRLLYVAGTRARDFLVLPWFANEGHYLDLLKQAFDPAIPGEAIATFFRRDGNKSTAAVERTSEPIRVDLAEPDPTQRSEIERLVAQRVEWEASREVLLARINEGRTRRTPSGLAEGEGEEAIRRREAETASAARAKTFGVAMHEALAKMSFEDTKAAKKLWESVAAGAGLRVEDVKRGEEMLNKFTQMQLFGRIRRAREIYREMPFAYQQGGTMMEGVLDLVFKDVEGWILLDYKTDQILAADATAHAERYRPQLDAYAYALQTIGGIRPAKILLFLWPTQEVRLG